MSFRATIRLSFSCCARYTTPIPPRPSTPRIEYPSICGAPARGGGAGHERGGVARGFDPPGPAGHDPASAPAGPWPKSAVALGTAEPLAGGETARPAAPARGCWVIVAAGPRSPGDSTRKCSPQLGQRTIVLIGIGLLDVKFRLHQLHRTWVTWSAI